MKKYLLILIATFIGLTAFSQTSPTLPSGAKPYGNQLYITPNGNIWGGVAGTDPNKGYRVIAKKQYVDSLIALRYKKTQVDSLLALKANLSYVNNEITNTVNYINTGLAPKADLTYVNTQINNTVDYINTGLALKQNLLGFTPENVANKVTTFTGASNTTYPTSKATNDAITALSTSTQSALANKADAAAISNVVGITLTAGQTTYTNTNYANKSAVLWHKVAIGTSLFQTLTFDASGVTALGFTVPAGYIGALGGSLGDLALYVPKTQLFDITIGKNKFNKANVITGFYINNAGNLIANAPSITSQWIPIDNTLAYYVNGRTTGGVRFRNASGTILPPNNADGSPRPDYTTAPSGANNGILYPPTGATDVQFTAILNSGTTDAIQLEVGTVATAYAAYTESYVIKTALIPLLNYVTTAQLNAAVAPIDTKVAIDYLFTKYNFFDKDAVVNGFYVNATTGVLSTNATSAVSAKFTVLPSTIYNISGRNSGQTEIVFYDSSNNRLKPYRTDGTSYTNYATTKENGSFMSPPLAVSVQFTVRFVGTGTYDSIMWSLGANAPPVYKPFSSLVIKDDLLPAASKNSLFKVIRNGSTISIRTSYDTTYDIFLKLTNPSANNLFNISSSTLLLKNDDDGQVGTQLNGAFSDDSAPSFFNGQILGGNHGGPLYKLTATAHGKTLADVGAIYTDANSKRFILYKIDDANNLSFLVENTSLTTTWVFPAPVSSMTYTSSGSSTTGITFTASSLLQLYPSIKSLSQKVLVDGNSQVSDGTYYGNRLTITEDYDIIDYPDMVTKLTSNRPVGGYLTQPTVTNGDAIVTISNVFQVQAKGTIALASTFYVRKDILIDYFGITQNGFVTPAWATTVRRYFPYVLPITNNGNTFDFRLMPEFKTPTLTGKIDFTSTYWENSIPTTRVVDLLQSSSLNVNFNLGYLPIGGTRSDMVNSAWEMIPSKKLYPRYIDGKIGTANVVSAGTVKQGVSFRGWSTPNSTRTNDILVEYGGKYYLFLDYHTAGLDSYTLPDFLNGKNVTVSKKSSNVTVLTPIVAGPIMIKVDASTPMYGYCELMIN
jgi:hypothetical protein